MEKILAKIEVLIEGITDPDRLERTLELATRLLEAYLKIRAL